jgi:hypothetical protein
MQVKSATAIHSTAAVLVLGAGAVLAQGMKTDERPDAPAAQQNTGGELVGFGRRRLPGRFGRFPLARFQSAPGAASPSSKSADEGKRSTIGQGKLSREQRTQITTIVMQHKVAPVRLNVSVTRVPDSVHLYTLPQRVFAILSGVARLRIHHGRRRDRRHQSAYA